MSAFSSSHHPWSSRTFEARTASAVLPCLWDAGVGKVDEVEIVKPRGRTRFRRGPRPGRQVRESTAMEPEDGLGDVGPAEDLALFGVHEDEFT